MSQLKARDIMTKDVVWIPESTNVTEAIRLFVDEMISGAPVVDEEGGLVGVVSLRDFARNTVITGQNNDDRPSAFFYETWELPITKSEANSFHIESESDQTVKDVMTPTLFYVDVDMPVRDVAEMMLKGRIHRVVVLENDELAGLITTMDMLKVVVNHAEV